MAKPPATRVPPMTETKLLILYGMWLLRAAASQMDWIELFLSHELIGYMDARLAFAELRDAGAIAEGAERDGERVVLLTRRGREILGHFFKRIPSSRREQMFEKVFAWRQELQEQRRHIASYYHRYTGEYRVRLRLRERGDTVYALEISAKDKRDAQAMVRNWKAASGDILEAIQGALTPGRAQEDRAARQRRREELSILERIEAAEDEMKENMQRQIGEALLEEGMDAQAVARITGLSQEHAEALAAVRVRATRDVEY